MDGHSGTANSGGTRGYRHCLRCIRVPLGNPGTALGDIYPRIRGQLRGPAPCVGMQHIGTGHSGHGPPAQGRRTEGYLGDHGGGDRGPFTPRPPLDHPVDEKGGRGGQRHGGAPAGHQPCAASGPCGLGGLHHNGAGPLRPDPRCSGVQAVPQLLALGAAGNVGAPAPACDAPHQAPPPPPCTWAAADGG